MARRWLTTVALAAVGALVLVVAPTVTTAPTSPPAVTLRRVALGAGPQRSGWRADANVTSDMVGVKWSGDPSAHFVVSTQDARGRWSAPSPLDTVDTGPDPGTREAAHATMHATEPMWVRGAKSVRVTLASGSAQGVELNALDAPDPKLPRNTAGAAVAPPGIISRAGWGADESLRTRNCSPAAQYSDSLRFAVIHHTVESNNYSPSDSFAIVRSIYAYSVLTLGYCDMMYNFLVDKYGQIFEGRFGGVDRPVFGAHAIGFNNESVGVAAIGDYTATPPSGAMIDAIERLVAWKFAVGGVDPRALVDYVTAGNDKFAPGSHVVIPPIVGHRDTWFTSCPGDALYAWLPAIRESVAERIEHEPMDVFPAWRPQAGAPKVLAMSAYGGLYPAGGSPAFTPGGWWPAWKIAHAVKLLPGGAGGYELDGFGGLHTFGAARPLPVSGYWPGWDIARDFVLLPSGTGGYVLDGFGGLHPFGTAPALHGTGYWPGWDIARSLVLLPSGRGGYVLDGFGGLHPFGNAPVIRTGGYWRGWDIARAVVAQPGTSFVYVLDGFGGLWPATGAPSLRAPYWGRDLAGGVALVRGGGYAISKAGTLRSFGSAPAVVPAFGPVAPPYVRELTVAP
jgi:hypothetical protein